MNKIIKPFLIGLSLLIISCNNGTKIKTFSGFEMDTVFDFKLFGNKREDKLQLLAKKAFELIGKLEDNYSVTRKNSLIFRLNRDKKVTADQQTIELFKRILKYSREVNGAFDISIYPVMLAWGFTTPNYHIPNTKNLKQIVENVDFRKIKVNDKEISIAKYMEIDPGGVVKGYAVDQVSEFFRTNGISAGLVNAGGNLKVFGIKPDGKPWIVGIRHPRKQGELYEIIPMKPNTAIATSGDYERYFITNNIRYHHLMDPKTGYPVKNGVISVSVIDPSAEKADLLSTALFILGKDLALEYASKHRQPVLIIMQTKKGLTNFQSKYWPKPLN